MVDAVVHSGAVDIDLSRPIEIDGASVSALRMREPTVGDQLAVQDIRGDAMQELTLFANLCEITPNDVKRLSMRDYRKLQAAWRGFID